MVCAVALAAVLALTTTACGIGDRERHAEAIRATRKLAATAPDLVGTLTYEVRLHPRSRSEFAQLRGTAAPDELVLRADLVLDADGSRSEVRFGAADLPAPPAEEGTGEPAAAVEPAPDGRPVAAIFDGETVFVKRQNLRPRERRTWARLDFEALPDEEPRPTRDDLSGSGSLVAVATTFDPGHVLDLAVGALAGSTKRRPATTLEDGTPVTPYSANVSIDKAVTDLELTEDDAATRLRMFRLLGVTADVVPARFWLREDGTLRRMRVELPQRVNRRRADTLVVTLDLTGAAPTPVAAAPAPEETVTYQRYGRMLRAAEPAV